MLILVLLPPFPPSKCCQKSEKSTFSAREQSSDGPAKKPSRSGNHMPEMLADNKGVNG